MELPGLNVLHAACADANTIICSDSGHVWVAGDNSRCQCGPLAVGSHACFKFSWIDPKTSWNGPNKTKTNDLNNLRKEVKVRGHCLPGKHWKAPETQSGVQQNGYKLDEHQTACTHMGCICRWRLLVCCGYGLLVYSLGQVECHKVPSFLFRLSKWLLQV